jgi:polysaccharide pyruvyl transferase WcaK-like protein
LKKELNVLHIASFIGNVGDNANHKGSEFLRDQFLDYTFNISRKEIREFYWKEWLFNSAEFVAEANAYDLVMIGGGNYFELWVENSKTGTSIDLDLEYLKKIETPILFYSLGCDLGQGVPEANVEKFKKFLDYLTDNNKYFVSVRNDGALSNIEKIYQDRYKDKISRIPDGGFFTDAPIYEHPELEKGKKNILINVAGDMLDVRFPNGQGKNTYEDFVDDFAQVLDALCIENDYNLNYIFVPHIFRDIKTSYDIIDKMNDRVRRINVKVAPYLAGDSGHDYIFSLYKQSDLILGTRFHSNVCSYAFEKNIIALMNYIQITNLYKDIDSSEFVEVNNLAYKDVLMAKIRDHLENEVKYVNLSRKIKQQLFEETRVEYVKINRWLKENLGGLGDDNRN